MSDLSGQIYAVALVRVLRKINGVVDDSQEVLNQCVSEEINIRIVHVPPRSGSNMTPLSAAISSLSLLGLRSVESAIVSRWRKRSRSRRPMPTVHCVSRFDRRVATSSSGPWYGRVRLRFFGGDLGASGGGVGGAR